MASITDRAMYDACHEYKNEYDKLKSICARIYYARIAMRSDLVTKGLSELDDYFRGENVN